MELEEVKIYLEEFGFSFDIEEIEEILKDESFINFFQKRNYL